MDNGSERYLLPLTLRFILVADSVAKLAKLKEELSLCTLSKTITKRELQSLTSLLQFTTKVIHPGRPFIRQLYAMQSIGPYLDIVWWVWFATNWNGISMLWDSSVRSPAFNIFRMPLAPGGCGAYPELNHGHIMHLIRILVFLAAHFDFWFIAKHIEGKANHLGDDLSHDNLSKPGTHWPGCAWFLEIAFVWEVGMWVRACVCVCACVCHLGY